MEYQPQRVTDVVEGRNLSAIRLPAQRRIRRELRGWNAYMGLSLFTTLRSYVYARIIVLTLHFILWSLSSLVRHFDIMDTGIQILD